jgi:phage baseplate assembly protein W
MAFSFDRNTGARLQEDDDIWQSIEDILTTPLGSRVWNREYGSELYDLLDSDASQARIGGVIADAVERHEPRVRVKTSTVRKAADGEFEIEVEIVIRATEERQRRGLRFGIPA